MKMEPTLSSETSAIRTQTPGNYPKRNTLYLEHGESLKTKIVIIVIQKTFIIFYSIFGVEWEILVKGENVLKS